MDFFKAGRKPTEILNPEDLKNLGLVDENKKTNRSEEQKRTVESSLAQLEEMKKEGLIVDSDRYGKIAVSIDKGIPAGFDAVRAFGCGTYIIWSPKEESFFISTAKSLTDKFSQGRKVRETMWIKPRQAGEKEKNPLTIKLQEILSILTDGKLQPGGKLQEFLDKERK